MRATAQIRNPLLLPSSMSIERPSVSRWGVEAGCTESRNLNHLSVVQTASSCFKTRLCSRIYWARLPQQPAIWVYMVGPSRRDTTECVDKETVGRPGRATSKKILIKSFTFAPVLFENILKNVFKHKTWECKRFDQNLFTCCSYETSFSTTPFVVWTSVLYDTHASPATALSGCI